MTARLLLTLLAGLLLVVGMIYFWQAASHYRQHGDMAVALRYLVIGGALLFIATILGFRATAPARKERE